MRNIILAIVMLLCACSGHDAGSVGGSGGGAGGEDAGGGGGSGGEGTHEDPIVVSCNGACLVPPSLFDCMSARYVAGSCRKLPLRTGTPCNSGIGVCIDNHCDRAAAGLPSTDVCHGARDCDDGNPCTVDSCPLPGCGQCKHEQRPNGYLCGEMAVCVLGECKQAQSCTKDTDCGTVDWTCSQRHCAAGVCANVYATAGTPATTVDTEPGDCHRRVCDGRGGTISIVDNDDVGTEFAECVTASCEGGIRHVTPMPAGSACAGDLCCGGYCDASGQCHHGVCSLLPPDADPYRTSCQPDRCVKSAQCDYQLWTK